MDEPSKPFELSPEQYDTASLIRRLLGSQIADRYDDFCCLAAGACALRVSSPMAGHALRELESIVRQTLAAPLEATQTRDPEAFAKVHAARQQLHAIGFDKSKIDAALDKLTPRLTHSEQIEAIVIRLGLTADGDIARAWKKLTGAHGKAHGRAFYDALTVDDQFRADWQAPMDTVMRGLMIQLQGQYAHFIKRVDELVAEKDCAKAAKSFSREIPGALPLLWHFFNSLQSPDWLPHLAKLNLLAAPQSTTEETERDTLPLREWPAGRYLQRMAACKDAKAQRRVAEALRAVGPSTHPHVLQSCLEILAALPAGEAALLVDLTETWLSTGDRFMVMGEGPHSLLRNLAAGQHIDEALRVMRTLFAVFEENGGLTTRFNSHMYEHFLPGAVKATSPIAGVETVTLLCDLLDQALHISRRVTDGPPHDYTHHLATDITEEGIKHDVMGALVGEIVDAAKLSLVADPSTMPAIIAAIRGHSPKVFVRIALHVLSLDPSASSKNAQDMLTDRELLGSGWCRKEYGELALAWFPSLTPAEQQEILEFVDQVPDQLRDGWKQRFEAHEKRKPTPQDEQSFNALIVRNLLWEWRAVLPHARRQFVENLGDPDAWRDQLFAEPTRPATTPDLARASLPDIVLFLQTWRPSATDKRETITVLARDLRAAALDNSRRYSTEGAQFADLPAIYPRNLLEGLATAAGNGRDLDWNGAFALIRAVLDRIADPVPSGIEGDDPGWSWCRKAAIELLAHGLRKGEEGIPFAHAEALLALVLTLNERAPRDPDTQDFEERYREFPHYGALSTARGAAVELALLLIFWLSKDPESAVGRAPSEALVHRPELARVFEAELRDRSSNGRIPRAIMGRYLSWLFYFAHPWLRDNFQSLFPPDDVALRDASWLSHLSADRGPIFELGQNLHDCIVAEIERLGQDDHSRDVQHVDNRLSEYLVLFYIAEALSKDVFDLFWSLAPLSTRKHAIWFLSIQLELPPDQMPVERRARAFSYWDRRLAAAKCAADPDAFREEIGSIGKFFFRQGIDGAWLMDQALAMADAGFVPTDPYSVLARLEKLSAQYPDRAAEVLTALVKNPHFDRWTYSSQTASLRTIMQNGLATRSPETETRVAEAINYFAAFGDTGYLDLLPTPSPGPSSVT